jgi:hypothetical protein
VGRSWGKPAFGQRKKGKLSRADRQNCSMLSALPLSAYFTYYYEFTRIHPFIKTVSHASCPASLSIDRMHSLPYL